MDLRTGARSTVRPNAGKLPWWIFVPARGVPGAGWRDYLALRKLRGATEGDTVAGLLAHNALYRNLIEPLAISALNTPVEAGSARLLWAVLAGSLAKGGAQCVPCFPRDGLSESFVDPAIAFIRAHGGEVRTASRIAGLRHDAGRITGLSGPDGIIEVTAGSSVILAVAAPNAAQLLPGLAVPDEFEAIINLHFRLVAPGSAPFAQAGFIGLIGGLSEWVFIKPGIVSVTISAANRLADRAGEELAASIWPEVCTALGLPPGDAAPMPPWRLIREKRATFAATPAQQRRRISATTPLRNLVLSGDWTNTGLPATIEGAISSGFVAAQRVGAPPLRGVLARLTA
jgi:squalene-associated FAD-dependent desaturase